MWYFSSKKSEVAVFIKQFSLRLTWPFRITWEVIFDPKLIPNEISYFPKAFCWHIQKDRPDQSLLSRHFSALKKLLQYQALPITCLWQIRTEWFWSLGTMSLDLREIVHSCSGWSPLLHVFYWRGGWDGPAEFWLCAMLGGWWLQTSSCG